MVVIDGGTIEDLAKVNILSSFRFEPKGTKKSLDVIYESRRIIDKDMRKLMELTADLMVAQRFLCYTKRDEIYVFSKDSQDNYHWKKANIFDRAMNYVHSFL